MKLEYIDVIKEQQKVINKLVLDKMLLEDKLKEQKKINKLIINNKNIMKMFIKKILYI